MLSMLSICELVMQTDVNLGGISHDGVTALVPADFEHVSGHLTIGDLGLVLSIGVPPSPLATTGRAQGHAEHLRVGGGGGRRRGCYVSRRYHGSDSCCQ